MTVRRNYAKGVRKKCRGLLLFVVVGFFRVVLPTLKLGIRMLLTLQGSQRHQGFRRFRSLFAAD